MERAVFGSRTLAMVRRHGVMCVATNVVSPLVVHQLDRRGHRWIRKGLISLRKVWQCYSCPLAPWSGDVDVGGVLGLE